MEDKWSRTGGGRTWSGVGRRRGPSGGQRKGQIRYREDESGKESGDIGGNRPPPGLKGRDLGLWYARRSKERGRGNKSDRMAKERTVAHINRKKLEMMEEELIVIQGLSEEKDERKTGILGKLEENVEGNRRRDLIRKRAELERRKFVNSSTDRMDKKMEGDEQIMSGTAEVSVSDRTEDWWDVKKEPGWSADMKEELVMNSEQVPGIKSIKIKTEQEQGSYDIKIEDTDKEFLSKSSIKTGGSDQGYCLPSTVTNCFSLSSELARQWEEQQNSSKYKAMLQFRKKLPSYNKKLEVVELVRNNQVVVLTGETGCGKTTQVPQFLLEDCLARGKGSTTRIVVTQPRRISAITVAERVAQERGERCGDGGSVGYQIRLESRLPRLLGSVLYCTTGIVLSWLRSSPSLPSISHLILDEVHERNIQSDFLITIIRDLLPFRPDLRIVLMSATLNADKFSQYFNNCAIINIPGFTFPVEKFYLEDVLELTKYKFPEKKPSSFSRWRVNKEQVEYDKLMTVWLRTLKNNGKYSLETVKSLQSVQCERLDTDLLAAIVNHIHSREGEGAILVFVPGWAQISKVHKLLTEDRLYRLGGSVMVMPLHSMMPTVSQREIFNTPPAGTRKVIIATNIAETSITIEDVVYVVDCGKIKMTNFDVTTNVSTLQPEWVSLANAKQRRGRAGRVQPGKCYHLFTRGREERLEQFLQPEMCRSRLEEVVLEVKLLQLGNVQDFLAQTLDPPDSRAIQLSLDLLQTMSAIKLVEGTEQLTPLGFHLAQLPMNPQTGKMILLAAIFSCLDPVLSVAASLSFKDAFLIPLGKEKAADMARQSLASSTRSDHLMLANALSEYETITNRGSFCWDNFLSESTLRLLLNMKLQFGEHLYRASFLRSPDILAESANSNSHNESLVRAVICAGLYPNVAKIKRVKRKPWHQTMLKSTSSTEKSLHFHPKSVLVDETVFQYPWLVYHIKMVSTKPYLYDASMVSPLSLLFFGETVRLGQERLGDGQVLETVSADNFVKFNCERRTALLVQRVRMLLDQILEGKISNPGPSQPGEGREGRVLKSIVSLLETEMDGGEEN